MVVDEIHAFAGDTAAGTSALLERLSRVRRPRSSTDRLSATVDNPQELLDWLQGSFAQRAQPLVTPGGSGPVSPEITVDYVGSLGNAATGDIALHQGEAAGVRSKADAGR